ncbi:MAG: alkaline phosphatase D family protein, partial [Bacteroidota bacterium]
MKLRKGFVYPFALMSIFFILTSCEKNTQKTFNFNNVNNRIWIGEEFWSIPIEDWRINEGRIECIGERANMRVNLITTDISGEGSFNFSVQMGMLKKGEGQGSAGIRVAIKDETDSDYRSLCYFGEGIDIGIRNSEEFFLGNEKLILPETFDLSSFILRVKGVQNEIDKILEAELLDIQGNSLQLETSDFGNLDGMISLVTNHFENGYYPDGSYYWFDNINIGGDIVEHHPEQSFGPVLWSMYTLSKGILKMTAQMPPLSPEDPQAVLLQMQNEGNWIDLSSANIDPDARIAVFRVENWVDTMDHHYRLVYELDGEEHYYEGMIRKEPDDGTLTMGGMTCQFHYGFPYRPLVENLDPDLLYFSGDQIYESNGGYGIVRFPADAAILNYLGKWYMFGWAFGDLMRDRPTIVIHDDHEVYQGNLWGEGGEDISPEDWEKHTDAIGGFLEPAKMVNVVVHTNSAHLPEPFDPEPIKQGIDVYYTDLLYGGVSFAIVGDRIFKSGPENVSSWEGRRDHIKKPIKDPSILDKEGLKLLGDRQVEFLENWVRDWEGSYLKILLSQTIFANAATHHGGDKMFLYGDLDSGGWPKSARDRALSVMRKAFAFHVAGDQHLPSLIQYGIDEYRDAGWAFCTPAITVGYQRRFLPDQLDWKVKGRPEHGNPNTGLYTDIFGNPNYIYAVGNPDEKTFDQNRYVRANKTASGFGYNIFDTRERTIKSEAYHFLADLSSTAGDDQFPGWPLTVSQLDNFGEEHYGYLPELDFGEEMEPVIRVYNTTE